MSHPRTSALVAESGTSNVKERMDLDHCQIVEGDLTMKIHRPDLFCLLDEMGWNGCEYRLP